jgi:hypothetical protein
MSRLSSKFLLLFLIIFTANVAICNAQKKGMVKGTSPTRAMVGKPGKIKTKNTRVKESPKIRKAKKEQARKEKKLKKDYNNFVDDNRKRAFQIQTPEVQARMLEDRKNIKAREKNKKKRISASTKKGAKKYK